MVDVLDALEKLQGAPSFKTWRKRNPDSFWAHAFQMVDKDNEGIWQFGFYNPTDTITTFIMNDEEITSQEESEIFREPEKKLEPLNEKKIKIPLADAIIVAKKLAESKYPQHPSMKFFVILQNLHGKDLYNVTFITHTLRTLNVKVDAETSEVIEERLTSIMDFKADK